MANECWLCNRDYKHLIKIAVISFDEGYKKKEINICDGCHDELFED